jgi:hypothetical protein
MNGQPRAVLEVGQGFISLHISLVKNIRNDLSRLAYVLLLGVDMAPAFKRCDQMISLIIVL